VGHLRSVTSQSHLKLNFSSTLFVDNNIIHTIRIMRDAATACVTGYYPQKRGKDKYHYGKTARKRSQDEIEVRSTVADFPAIRTHADRMTRSIGPAEMTATRHRFFSRITGNFC
jgi:hypothetical protein